MTDRGQSELVGQVLLVGLVVAAVSLGAFVVLFSDDGGGEQPLIEYEFDYDPETGLVEVTHLNGDPVVASDLDSLVVIARTDDTVERATWASLAGTDEPATPGSSVSVDDANGPDLGSFTVSGAFEPGATVSVVFEDGPESYRLGSYTVPEASRSYVQWAPPTEDLDNRYPLDETGFVAADEAGDADGVVRGSPTVGVDGQVGSAYEFNDGLGRVALDRSYSGSGSVDALSACAWFNTDVTGTGEFDNWALVDFDRSEYFNLYVRGDTGGVGFSTSGESSTTVDHSTSTDYADGNWHLACGVYDAGTDSKRIYVDGTLEVDVTAANPDGLGTGTTRYGFIGDGSEASSFDGSRNGLYYEGRVDEVRIYDEALSASEVQSLYDAGTGSGTAPTGGLVNHWPLDEADDESGGVRDVAGSADGTLVGSSTVRGETGRLETAYEFSDGSGHVALGRTYDGAGAVDRLTACGWFKTSETGTGEFDNWALVDFDRSEYFNLYVRGDTGGVGFSTSGGSSIAVDHSTSTDYADGSWHLACGVYDAGTDSKRIYVDGTLEVDVTAQNTDGLGTGATRYGFIGDGSEASSFDGSRNGLYYDGTVDDVRLYNRTLSTADVERLWAFTGGGPATHVTETRQFLAPVDVSKLRLENVETTIPSGTGIDVTVEADTDGDGTYEQTSDTVTLDGSDSYSLSGLSGTASTVRLELSFSTSGSTAPTVRNLDLAVGDG